jgi:hypothetical protein
VRHALRGRPQARLGRVELRERLGQALLLLHLQALMPSPCYLFADLRPSPRGCLVGMKNWAVFLIGFGLSRNEAV